MGSCPRMRFAGLWLVIFGTFSMTSTRRCMVVIGHLTHLCGGGGCLILRQVPGLMRIGTLPLLQRRRCDELRCAVDDASFIQSVDTHAAAKKVFTRTLRLVLRRYCAESTGDSLLFSRRRRSMIQYPPWVERFWESWSHELIQYRVHC